MQDKVICYTFSHKSTSKSGTEPSKNLANITKWQNLSKIIDYSCLETTNFWST